MLQLYAVIEYYDYGSSLKKSMEHKHGEEACF